jgi:hypothetical protein
MGVYCWYGHIIRAQTGAPSFSYISLSYNFGIPNSHKNDIIDAE